jgi:broad specificity phosphatase PhoE
MGTRVLYLVRHGQYVTDDVHRRYGHLTKLGRQQAQRTAKRLANVAFDGFFHSDLPRAVETAEIIAKRLAQLPRHRLSTLREINPPLPRQLESKALSRAERHELDVLTTQLFKKFFHAPKGERCRAELIVTHGNLIRYLIRLALGDKVSAWWKMSTNHCGLTVIVIRSDGLISLLHYNDVGHLPPLLQTMS